MLTSAVCAGPQTARQHWHPVETERYAGVLIQLIIFRVCAEHLHIPYWQEIITHNYIISAPAGCNLIQWGRGLHCKTP